MNTSAKLGGFVAGLAVILAVSYVIGTAVGPVRDSDAAGSHPSEAGVAGAGLSEPTSGEPADGTTGVGLPDGLMVSHYGYTLQLSEPIPAGGRTAVAFEVIGPDGRPAVACTPTHEKDLHLIAVRRDTTGFQHVHPTMDATGTWSTDLDLTPGVWRLFADFQPASLGEAITLGVDASVAGSYDPQPLPADTRTAKVDDYTVTLAGDLAPGTSSELNLTVSRQGRPVTDLQPYLGAYGHLVALRAGDLAYLHVHPDGEPGDGTTQPGPEITFYATVPTAGSYRLFLNFLHDGVVRTAEFTVTVAPQGPTTTPDPTSTDMTTAPAESGGHGH